MKAVLSSLCLLLFAGFAAADVTVVGTGKVTYTPDQATVGFGVSSKGQTAEEAWAKNKELVAGMVRWLEANGFKAEDMQTAGFNLTPEYRQPKEGDPVLIGYVATYDLRLTVRKLDDLGHVLDELVRLGVNRNLSLSFGCSKVDALLHDARLKAVQDARAKAELYATASGGHLGKVVSISETGAWEPHLYRLEAPAKGSFDSLPVLAGQQEVSVSVTVAYALSNRLEMPARGSCDSTK